MRAWEILREDVDANKDSANNFPYKPMLTLRHLNALRQIRDKELLERNRRLQDFQLVYNVDPVTTSNSDSNNNMFDGVPEDILQRIKADKKREQLLVRRAMRSIKEHR